MEWIVIVDTKFSTIFIPIALKEASLITLHDILFIYIHDLLH